MSPIHVHPVPIYPANHHDYCAEELARLCGMEGKVCSGLLHSVAPAEWTPLGRPAWALEPALRALRPDLARQLTVARCRLADPGAAGPCP